MLETRISASKPPWHAKPAEEILRALQSDSDGLSSGEAACRIAREGRNELREGRRIEPWRIFARQFGGLLVGILLGASVISALFGDWFDCVAILAIILLNAFVGFYQELSAEKSIAAL